MSDSDTHSREIVVRINDKDEPEFRVSCSCGLLGRWRQTRRTARRDFDEHDNRHLAGGGVMRLSYQHDHAENPCGQCGAAPGVVCEHDDVALLGVVERKHDTREPAPKIAKGEG